MGIVNKIFGEKGSGDVDGYIDLEKYVESTGDQTTGARMFVRVGEIQTIDFSAEGDGNQSIVKHGTRHMCALGGSDFSSG